MLKVIVALLCILPLVGCAGRGSLPKTFPSTVQNWQGKLDKVEFIKDFNITDYARVRVDSVTSTATLPDYDSNTYKPVQNVLAKATDYFTVGMKNGVSGIKVDNEYAAAGRTLVVHATVTEIDPGSAALRFWLNFGAGSVHVKVSGEVSDAATGQTLLRFEAGSGDAAMSSFGLEGYEGLMAGSIERCGKSVGEVLNAFTPVK